MISALLLPALLWTAELSAPGERFLHRAFTIEDGLPADRVYRVAQDAQGYLLLGMERGLVRFDGFKFVVAQPAPGGFEDYLMLAEPNGDQWLSRYGKGGGQLCLIHNNQLQPFKIPDFMPGSKSKQAILSMLRSRSGSLWMGGYFGGLLRIDPNGASKVFGPADGFPASIPVNALLESRDGVLWIATSGAGVLRFDGKQFLSAWSKDRDVFSLAEDAAGNIWAGTGAGLAILGTMPMPKQLLDISDRINALVSARDGSLWVGTDGHGLYHFHNGLLENYNEASGLTNNVVWSILEDKHGAIWTGTRSGLDRFTHALFTQLKLPPPIVDTTIGPMLRDQEGGLWLAPRSGGLFHLRNGLVTNWSPRLKGEKILAMCLRAQGGIWLGSGSGGLLILDKGELTHFSPTESRKSIRSPSIETIWEDRRHSLWLGQWGVGVMRLDGESFRLVPPADGNPAPALIRGFTETKSGDLWVADGSAGILRIRNGQFIPFAPSEGQPPQSATAVHTDSKDRVWVAGAGVISVYHNGRFQPLSLPELPIDGISEMFEDTHSGFWLAGEGGVYRLALAEVEAQLRVRAPAIHWTRFGRGDGLGFSVMKYSHPAIIRGEGDSIWFASARGIVAADTSRDFSSPAALPIVETLRANGQDVSLAGPIRLGPGVARLQFLYTGLYPAAPEKVIYRYRLTGFDQKWVEAGSQRSVEYTNLEPGSYQFQLAASLGDGIWTSQPTTVSLSIEPFFYQTAWFALLSVTLLVMTAFALIYWRVRTMRQNFELVLNERTRIAREIHDTLLQGFAGIAWQLDALSKDIIGQPQSSKAKLDDLLKQMDYCLAEARRTITDMRVSRPDETHLNDKIASLCSETPHATFRLTGAAKTLDTARAESIYSFIREALRNASQHSQASRIQVTLSYGDSTLFIQVEDNGIGFSPDKASTGNHWGLPGMKERVAYLGGQISIRSAPGEGALILAEIPLQASRHGVKILK